MIETLKDASLNLEQALEHDEDPLVLFDRWLDDASRTEPSDPNAMSLATATADGIPSCG